MILDGPNTSSIDSRELAARWAVPETWIREQVRFRWRRPELKGWAN